MGKKPGMHSKAENCFTGNDELNQREYMLELQHASISHSYREVWMFLWIMTERLTPQIPFLGKKTPTLNVYVTAPERKISFYIVAGVLVRRTNVEVDFCQIFIGK